MLRNQRAAFKKLGIAAMLVAALLLGGNLTKATTAHAAPAHTTIALTSACASSPSHAHCDGVDPYAAGCVSGSYAVRSATLYTYFGAGPYGTVYVIWSPTCQTNWARTVMNDNGGCLYADCWLDIHAQLWLIGSGGSLTYLSQLNNSTYGYDYCDNWCGATDFQAGTKVWYGNMYYAPTADVQARGFAEDGSGTNPYACAYTGYTKPACASD
ncbi:MAG: hypothetical protein OJF49_001187 [Ktedonobacterales bacterium]|nr:MAG: hypothetical protein OJF49_001187 [Ktedonobacterales bacterium]